MSLFDSTYGGGTATNFNIHVVSAGDAAAMETALFAVRDAAITAGETNIVDFKLSGTGAGPNWEALLVTSGNPSDTTVAVALSEDVQFSCVVGGNHAEVESKLKAAIAAANAESSVSNVYKIELAGAGIGTIFMGAALYVFGGG